MARTRQQAQVQAREPTRRSGRLSAAKDAAAAAARAQEEASNKITKRKRFRRPQQRKSCRLLALPGELRNAIYRYAVVESDSIEISPSGPGRPALLKSSRRIRLEAQSIYYCENRFSLQVQDYNGAAFSSFAWQVHGAEPLLRRTEIGFKILGSPNWDNMVAWLKSAHETLTLLPDLDAPAGRDDFIVGAAMKLCEGRPWEPWTAKKEKLDAFYHGLRGTLSKWVKHEDRFLGF